MLGINQAYDYSWMFLSNSTKYIWQLTKNIAAIVIHMVAIHEWPKDSYMACLCMLEHLDGRISLPFEWDAESTKVVL